MTKMKLGGCIFAILALAASGTSVGADSPPPPVRQRPRIGLVLSGGGARGVAHIGVLKVMEELKVPVDCIAATSMGSIVGGFYSAGMSPQEMQDTLAKVNWGQLLSPRLERKQIVFRRKEDDSLSFLPFELGIGRKGISMKSGIISGGKIDFLFQSLTLNTAGFNNFDQLRVPFRAVAADLETGEPVILDHGSLAGAMRASMSIPGIFMPVEWEGHVLIDGGIAMNLPVDVARDLCAERVIAIDVGTPPKTEVKDLGTLGVLSQMNAVMAQRNVVEQISHMSADDLLITPDLDEVKTGDFAKIDVAIAAGVAAARQYENELRAFAVSESEYEEFLGHQRRRDGSDTPEKLVDDIRVQVRGRDGSVQPSSLLERRIRTETGKPLDFPTLYKDMERIGQGGEYENVKFEVFDDQGQADLVIEARDKEWGPGYISLGIGAESNFEGDSNFRAIIRYRRPGLNRLGAEVKSILGIGSDATAFAEFYQPLSYSGFWFVAPRVNLEWESDMTFLSGDEVEVIQTRSQIAGLDFGIQLRNYGELRVGVVRGNLDRNPITETTFSPLDRDIGAARLKATLDQLDSAFFPTHGNFSQLDLYFSREGLGADDKYSKGEFRTVQAWSAWRGTLLGSLNLGTDFGSDVPEYDEFRLGGFLNLSGLERGRLQGDVKGLAELVTYWRVGNLTGFARNYLGASIEAGNTWDEVSQAEWNDLNYNGSLFFGLDTRFMPIYLGVGFAEGGENSVFFFIGRPF